MKYFDISFDEDELEEEVQKLKIETLIYDEMEYRYRSGTVSYLVAPLAEKEREKLEKYILSSGPFNPYWNPIQSMYICYEFKCSGSNVSFNCLPTTSESIECLLMEKRYCSLCDRYFLL